MSHQLAGFTSIGRIDVTSIYSIVIVKHTLIYMLVIRLRSPPCGEMRQGRVCLRRAQTSEDLCRHDLLQIQELPNIVLGPPDGGGPTAGSLDVLTLGHGGEIVLEFTEYVLSDGPGYDLMVFENAFSGWIETAVVSASTNGTDWEAWPCDSTNPAQGFPGCAGVEPVLSNQENCIDATDPTLAGGDKFDLAEIGLDQVRFIKLVDTGSNLTGGFDLDAIAIIHGTLP